MVEPQNLILGCWVRVPDEFNDYRWNQVVGINENGVYVDVYGADAFHWYDEIKPIPITGTILEKFGFELDQGGVWNHSMHPIAIKRKSQEEWSFPYWPLLGASYLHDLQVIFYFLTGKEMDPIDPNEIISN